MDLLRAQFPQAEQLAYERIFAGQTIFFDTKSHARLFAEPLIFAALILANFYAHQVGATLKLTAREKRLWDRHFSGCQ